MINFLHYTAIFLGLLTAILGIVVYRRAVFEIRPIIRYVQFGSIIQFLIIYYRTFTLPENPLRRAMVHWFTASGQWFPFQVQYNNLPFFHIIGFVEDFFLFLFFRKIFKSRRIINFVLLFYIALVITDTILLCTIEPLLMYNSVQKILTSAFVFVFGILYFYELYSRAEVSSLLAHWQYWMVGVLILFKAGTFFKDLAANLFLFSDQIELDVFIFQSILWIIFCLTIITILWKTKRA